MTRDDIIRLAREAGLYHFHANEEFCTGITTAHLKNRERDKNDEVLVYMLAPFAALVAAAEREACAKLCEDGPLPKESTTFTHISTLVGCAAAIRARGE